MANDNFMLKTDAARELYAKVKDLPIFDYHCHLSPKEIYEDRVFNNITELWLEADHYKWRIMRIAGIDEEYITGNKSDYEKFYAFCKVFPNFIGNPVYHWAHMELKKYFNIDLTICEEHAKEIWDITSKALSTGKITARKLIEESNVDTVITTDDPIDNLEYHKKLRDEKIPFKVFPCFRADGIININIDEFVGYITKLEQAVGFCVEDIDNLITAINARMNYFVHNGCVAVDCSIRDFPKFINPSKLNANIAFQKKLEGYTLTEDDKNNYKFFILKEIARMCHKKDLVMQIHAGVIRNQNAKRYRSIGADSGGDCVGNPVDTDSLGRLLDRIEHKGHIPKMIVYTLNHNDYNRVATMLGCFAYGTPGRLQLGAAWWFNDHREGIVEQVKVTANTLGLGYFNGMLTDSRSFLSFPRHDYFRRILCSIIGDFVTMGEYKLDDNLIKIMQNICYYNAKNNFSIKEVKE